MSNNIPFEIQVEILKRLPVESLIQFRSVSKAWKSLIDSSRFIAGYSRQQQHLLVRYDDPSGRKYVSIVDDDSFPQKRVSMTVTLLVNILKRYFIVGSSHGLLCLYSCYDCIDALMPRRGMAVLWNPAVRKTVVVVVPNVGDDTNKIYETVVSFGVCRETNDPKIVKITYIRSEKDIESISCIPWQVEVFTLSTGFWRCPRSGSLPRKSIHFNLYSVVIDGVLYWLATDRVTVDGGFRFNNLIISFDVTSEEFKEINLPDILTRPHIGYLSIFKTRESLVVYDRLINVIWMIEDGVSNLFIERVNMPGALVMGFRKSGEPLIQVFKDGRICKLVAYEPYSKHMDDVGIEGIRFSFCVHPYVETLLLLDQPNLKIYDETENFRLPRNWNQ